MNGRQSSQAATSERRGFGDGLLDWFGKLISPSLDALGPLTYSTDDSQRGRSAILGPKSAMNPEIIEEAELVSCRAREARGRLLGVVLGLETLDLPAEPNEYLVDYSVRAYVTGGLGATPFEFCCDWQNGVQISVVSETLRVRAVYVRQCPAWAGTDDTCDPCPPRFRVTAGVGYADTGINSNPMRLTEMVAIANPAESVLLPIPPFAVSFNFQQAVGSIAAKVEIVGSSSVFNVEVNFTAPLSNVAQHNVENAFPLRNGARYLKITNMNVDSPLYGFAIFGLKP